MQIYADELTVTERKLRISRILKVKKLDVNFINIVQ